ncbi:hypothetical protein [Mumia quercus]|uniref:hypothetical protein n=1 Tax=Mumia quercus TaxID=2976125 RepID=UPI0021CF44E3|nr:hypothetical protein [Mumia quercus]
MENATRLLVLAAEDYTGLWDAAFEMAHESSAEDAARDALTQLLTDGLIRIFVGFDPAIEVPVELEPSRARAALAPGPHWEVPAEGTQGDLVYFAATDEGVSRIRELRWGEGT